MVDTRQEIDEAGFARGPTGVEARHLLPGHIPHVRRDGPPVPERIDDVPVPVTVELVLRGALQRRSEFHRAGDDRVDVLDIEHQADWSSAQRLRAAGET